MRVLTLAVAILLSATLLSMHARADDAIPGVGLKPTEKAAETQPKADDDIPPVGLKPAPKAAENKAAENQPKADDEITVLGKRIQNESDLVGAYKQPLWTATRRFSTTRVYVAPAGTTTFEYWLETDGDLTSGSSATFKSSYELELGLGNHLQLDLYLTTKQGKEFLPLAIDAEKIELRWAPWDWGVIFGNPAIYLEWIRQHEGPQKAEVKLLLGDAFTPELFWGLNLVYERELGADDTQPTKPKFVQEYAAAFGLSYALVNGIFSVGVEGKAAMVDAEDSRFDFSETTLLLGPSFQVRPIRGVHIDLVTMFGARIEEDETTPIYTVFLIFGKEWLGF